MDAHEIKALIDAMAASDLTEMEAVHDGWTLRLVRLPGRAGTEVASSLPEEATETAAGPRSAGDEADDESLVVKAPLAGFAYLASAPGGPAFAPVGASVDAGATVCLIEAMKTFVEVKAERGGSVEAVLVRPGDEVRAGQPILRIARGSPCSTPS